MEWVQTHRKAIWLGAALFLTVCFALMLVRLPPFPRVEISTYPGVLLAAGKLAMATVIGILVAVQRADSSERLLSRPMEQAQVLLCIAGALIVMLIGDSMARAIGILGGAAIVRFRTPVEDPKEATVLFLLLGLGMATGLGYFAVAALGALFLCALLTSFGGLSERKMRGLCLEVVCAGSDLPVNEIESVLKRHAVSFEPRVISRGDHPTMRYQLYLPPPVTLAAISRELFDSAGSSIQSISWDAPKKERFAA